MPPSPKLNARQAKHLEFQAAPVPKFLQSFKEKVQPALRRSEWEETLGVGPARDSRDDGLLPDSDGEGEDEWEGAHVVVLDDKKDLTLEQARQASRIQPPAQAKPEADESRSSPTTHASEPGAPLRSKRRAAPLGQADKEGRKILRTEESGSKKMSDVRALIAERRGAASKTQDEKLARRVLIEEEDPRDKAKAEAQHAREVVSKASAKDIKKKKRNQAARREIKKSGKGLSFDLHD